MRASAPRRGDRPINTRGYLVKEPADVARFADILREAFYLERALEEV